VDPRLPRWAIRWLAGGALAGVLSDAASLAMGGALAFFAEESVIAWAFLALAVLTVVLLIGVWLSLREPSYSGVMAATGLSYLAVLTALGATVAGRLLVL
ncbi:MAG: hypothetical protein M3N51_05915, partial [Actinomycetota bacterium]|nr:hypothetical protein [Actinomycetota bacterium]